jgi:hypothetical protein
MCAFIPAMANWSGTRGRRVAVAPQHVPAEGHLGAGRGTGQRREVAIGEHDVQPDRQLWGRLLLCASLAVLNAERHHAGANIANFGDALWWSALTATTVGYGDRFPVTADGRFMAAGLTIGAIALLGTVTASLASWLIKRVRQ